MRRLGRRPGSAGRQRAHPGFIEYGSSLRRDLTAAIRGHRPYLVVLFNHHDTWPGGRWNTPDHRNTGRAALDAARRHRQRDENES